RRRGAGERAAGLRGLARRRVERPVARHGAQRRAARHRRGPPARLLAALERADGGGRVNTPVTDAVSRAEVEDLFYYEAELLDAWQLDEWLTLLADDATYYVPPNDKPDADHRY